MNLIITIVLSVIGIYLAIGLLLGIRAVVLSPVTLKIKPSIAIVGFLLYMIFWFPMQIAARKTRKNKKDK